MTDLCEVSRKRARTGEVETSRGDCWYGGGAAGSGQRHRGWGKSRERTDNLI